MSSCTTTPTNTERAARILPVLTAYGQASGDPAEDHAEAVTNLLVDLQHFATAQGLDFEDLLNLASFHYQAEAEGPSPLPIHVEGHLDLLLSAEESPVQA